MDSIEIPRKKKPKIDMEPAPSDHLPQNGEVDAAAPAAGADETKGLGAVSAPCSDASASTGVRALFHVGSDQYASVDGSGGWTRVRIVLNSHLTAAGFE